MFVRIDSLNASSIDYLIYAFTYTKDWGEWLEIKEEFAVAVMDIIARAGTDFAFPSQTVYLQQTDPPEIIAPPARSESAERASKAIENTRQPRGIGEVEKDS